MLLNNSIFLMKRGLTQVKVTDHMVGAVNQEFMKLATGQRLQLYNCWQLLELVVC
jgi:hypothetical protein